MGTTTSEHLQAGRLQDAIQALNSEIRARPTDVERRGLLAELLCVAGDLERADRQLDIIADQDSSLALGLALFRQLVRGEVARQQCFGEGRLPEFLTPPPDHVRLHLQACIALREGDPAEAARLLAEAEAQRPARPGVCGETPFDDMRDLDDVTSCFFEVLTSNGNYYWVPHGDVVAVEFHAGKRPRDLLWRRAQMTVRDGPEGDVYLPAIYVSDSADANARLGRITDWIGGDGAPTRGVGQRTYLIGDESVPIMDLESIRFQDG